MYAPTRSSDSKATPILTDVDPACIPQADSLRAVLPPGTRSGYTAPGMTHGPAKTMSRLFFLAAALVVGGCSGSQAPPAVVANVDFNRYAGVWYEVARLPNPFERDCFAARRYTACVRMGVSTSKTPVVAIRSTEICEA